MKVHFKVVCVVLVVLWLVAGNESWWLKRSSSGRSSRRSSSSSRSSSSRHSSWSGSTSRRYRSSSSSSFRRRRGWFIRRHHAVPTQVKPTVETKKSQCRIRFRYSFYDCKETILKTTTKAPRKVSTPTPYTTEVSKLNGGVRSAFDCKTQLRRFSIPSWIIYKILNKPQICKKVVEILRMLEAKMKSTTSSVFQDVKSKYVKSLTTVERPFNDGKNGEHGEKAITFLNSIGIKTSITNNPNTITHSGVLVTTEDEKTYLIHKMKGKNTRVEDRPNLFDDGRWKSVKTIKPKKRLTINDYYSSTEPNKYNLRTSNCHDATEWMVQLAG